MGPRRTPRGPRSWPKLTDSAYDRLRVNSSSLKKSYGAYLLDRIATVEGADVAFVVTARDGSCNSEKRESKEEEEEDADNTSEHVDKGEC